MYIAIKNSDKQGVYRRFEFNNEWRKKGVNVKHFKKENLKEALKWAGVRQITRLDGFTVDVFLKKYRESQDSELKIKMISKLKKYDKKIVILKLTLEELNEYVDISSKWINERYYCIKRHKDCLDLLVSHNPDINKIRDKYINLDLSIPVYTIKSIISVYETISFYKKDIVYNHKIIKIYKQCKWYNRKIESKWNTDTKISNHTHIKNKYSSKNHKNANKVKLILKQLER